MELHANPFCCCPVGTRGQKEEVTYMTEPEETVSPSRGDDAKNHYHSMHIN
jgi:hypothetical protein